MAYRTKPLPKNITVGGITFKIKQVKQVDSEDSQAEFCGADRIIRIKRGLSDELRESVLWHELIHAALYTAGVSQLLASKLEESIVLAIEHNLGPLYERRRK